LGKNATRARLNAHLADRSRVRRAQNFAGIYSAATSAWGF